jgi:hypothetical protein
MRATDHIVPAEKHKHDRPLHPKAMLGKKRHFVVNRFMERNLLQP